MYSKKVYNFLYRRIGNRVICNALTKVIVYLSLLFDIQRDFLCKKNNNNSINYEQSEKNLIRFRKPSIINFVSSKIKTEKIIYNLSIIIPVYNVERFIEECLDSVVNQKTKFLYEVIVINDGSTDASLDKINNYSSNIIKIINQKNRGLAATRNVGLEVARGEYLMFLDSDDRLPDNTIEKLLNEAYELGCDIVEGNILRLKEDGSKTYIRDFTENTDIYEANLKNSERIFKCTGFACGKIYNRKLWDQVTFPEGFIFEDTIIKLIIMRRATRYKYIKDYVYEYRENSKSITANLNNDYRGLDTVWIINNIMNMLDSLEIEKDHILYKLLVIQFSSIMRTRLINFNKNEMMDVVNICKKILLQAKKDEEIKLPFFMEKVEKSIISNNYDKWCIWQKYI